MHSNVEIIISNEYDPASEVTMTESYIEIEKVSETHFKIKQTVGDKTDVVEYDFSNIIPNIKYLFTPTNDFPLLNAEITKDHDFQGDLRDLPIFFVKYKSNNSRLYMSLDATDPSRIFADLGTPNRTYTLPIDTHHEWIERISPRVLHLTRRVSILRHEEPHLSSRSRRVCLDLDDRNEYVHRYDHSINLMRLPVGKLQLDINTYNNRWDSHERKVAKAKEKGNPIPEFDRFSDRDDIETLLEKLEEKLTEDALLEHHETHNTNEWRNAHAERRVVLCNDDCSVGELLLDINRFHTDRHGNTNHELAEQSFHDIAVTHWNEAKRTTHRTLVTERIVTIPEE